LRLDGKKRRERQKVGTKVREETRPFLGESQGWEQTACKQGLPSHIKDPPGCIAKVLETISPEC
jgi:hypothetical protein